MIEFEDFKKVDLRVGKVVQAEPVEGSEKLVKLQVDLGEKDETGNSVTRQILAGIIKEYTPEKLIGLEIIVVINLKPRKFKIQQSGGIVELESEGMLLAAHGENGEPVLLMPDKEVLPGSQIS